MAISKSNSFSPTSTIKSAEVNENFNDVINAIRGSHHSDSDGTQIDNDDVLSGAEIAESKLLFSATGHRHEGATDGRNIREEGLASDADSFGKTTAGQFVMSGIHMLPNNHKQRNLGSDSKALNNTYADDYINVGDYVWLDTKDDLKVLDNIKPSNEYSKKNGLRLINDDTLPGWLLHKVKGKTVYDSDGKPYVSLRTFQSLLMGAIRQLHGKVKVLEANAI